MLFIISAKAYIIIGMLFLLIPGIAMICFCYSKTGKKYRKMFKKGSSGYLPWESRGFW